MVVHDGLVDGHCANAPENYRSSKQCTVNDQKCSPVYVNTRCTTLSGERNRLKNLKEMYCDVELRVSGKVTPSHYNIKELEHATCG